MARYIKMYGPMSYIKIILHRLVELIIDCIANPVLPIVTVLLTRISFRQEALAEARYLGRLQYRV